MGGDRMNSLQGQVGMEWKFCGGWVGVEVKLDGNGPGWKSHVRWWVAMGVICNYFCCNLTKTCQFFYCCTIYSIGVRGITFLGRAALRLSVNTDFVWPNISLLNRGFLLKLDINIHHASGHCRNDFQGCWFRGQGHAGNLVRSVACEPLKVFEPKLTEILTTLFLLNYSNLFSSPHFIWKQCSCISIPVFTSSSSSDDHSCLKRFAPVRLPSPPMHTRLVMLFWTRFFAACRRPSRVLKSLQRALPITVPP